MSRRDKVVPIKPPPIAGGVLLGMAKRPKDLGTYWLRVEGTLSLGDSPRPFGFLFRVETARAYSGGAVPGVAPLDAPSEPPPFEDEHELVQVMKALFTTGLLSCPCNLNQFISAAEGNLVATPHHEEGCATLREKYSVERLTLIKPNRSERVIHATNV